MSYRIINPGISRGMADLSQSPTTWDKYDWTIAGLAAVALWIGWAAMKSATRRLR